MPLEQPPDEAYDEEDEEIREVVPGRAVLTELARGFLLVHESNPARAVRFAETFLREHAGRTEEARVATVPRVTVARLSLGRGYRGAIEPAATASTTWSSSE